MNILVIGGTRFVGRHFVEAALARKHTITLFNRGKSNDELFPNVEHLHGDRDGDLGALAGRKWDAVVDTCGYVPRVVRQSAELLKDAVGRYLFISTISVYQDIMEPGADEDAPLQTMDDPTNEDIAENYGALKVLCEQVVEEVYGDRALIVRPGMIVGPYDPTDRFTYWAVRVAHGGEILVPGTSSRPVQMIDARDLAAWMVRLLEAETDGVFNATGPDYALNWGSWLEACRAAAGGVSEFVWMSDEFLQAHEVTGGELPFWIPAEYANTFAVSVKRATAAGLTFRPLIEIVRDTLAWKGTPPVSDLRAGMKPEREAELLAAWRAQT